WPSLTRMVVPCGVMMTRSRLYVPAPRMSVSCCSTWFLKFPNINSPVRLIVPCFGPRQWNAREGDSSVIIRFEQAADRAIGKFRQHAVGEGTRIQQTFDRPRFAFVGAEIKCAALAFGGIRSAVQQAPRLRAVGEG